jgi:D-alanyl-lipoteichoic acid acyltransferase DltB (MBOAT superfamily)
LYIPLGGSKGGTWFKIRNTFIIFLVSGFWHGANWTFVVWGGLNAIYFLPLLLSNKNRSNLEIVTQGKHLPDIKELMQMGTTFFLTVFAWIFFRANSMEHAISYISQMLSASLFSLPNFGMMENSFTTIILIIIFIIVEWFGREGQYALENMKNIRRKSTRWLVYFLILIAIYFWGNFEDNLEFIYFQF